MVQFSAQARDFPLFQIIGSGTHPVFYSMSTGPNRTWHEADHSTPLSSEVKNEKIYTSLPIHFPGVHKDITLTFCKSTHTLIHAHVSLRLLPSTLNTFCLLEKILLRFPFLFQGLEKFSITGVLLLIYVTFHIFSFLIQASRTVEKVSLSLCQESN